jgi:hypothetical protein
MSASWPVASHFSTMLQNPQHAFRDPELKKIEIQKDDNRQPRGLAGSFAVVYKGSRPNGAGSVAIRVFTSAAGERRERYNAISSYLQSKRLSSLVGFRYSDDGVRSAGNGKWYPLIVMDWVPGETLFKWTLRQCYDKNASVLRRAADHWLVLVDELAKAKVAHGDLQHANVMVTQTGELKLVDYDCMCVPDLVGRKNLEIGVEPYQHPERDSETLLSPELDNYSALFILTALRALGAAPDLWQRFVEARQYEKLLFRREDLDEPTSSELCQALKHSSDKEVPRLLDELVRLRQGPMSEVPRLSEVLFSYDKVASLLTARDFDAAVALVARSGKPASAAPAALQPRLRDAQERVQRLAELEKAVAAGDERQMQKLYAPKLLDDYPQAQPAVAVARLAAQVLPVIEQLERAHKSHDGRQLVRLWDAQQKLLHARKSAARFEAEVANWRQRNQLCDAVLALLEQPECDAAELETVWRKLQAAGGHPEADGQRSNVDRLLRRAAAWTAFERVPAAASQTHDAELLQGWHEPLFAGWPKAEAQRPRMEKARHRLARLQELERLAAAGLSLATEEAIDKCAAGLPAHYEHSLAKRVAQAHDRLRLVAELHAAVKDPAFDLAIAAAWQKLHALGGLALAPGSLQKRAELAAKRANVLQTLKQIPPDYSIDRAPQYDARLLGAWNEPLLANCRDADPWRPARDAAERRTALLAELKEAVTTGDPLRMARLAAEPCLVGYPLPADWQRLLGKAASEVGILQRLLDLLERHERTALHEVFDARVVRRYALEFQPYAKQLQEWLAAEMRSAERLGLAPAVARRSLVHEPGNNGTFRACWSWPGPRFTERCLLAICRNMPRTGDDPTKIHALFRLPIDRKSYEEGGGSRVFHVEPAWSGAYVVVWALVELGGGVVVASEPLVLGRLPNGGKETTRESGGFFSRWIG